MIEVGKGPAESDLRKRSIPHPESEPPAAGGMSVGSPDRTGHGTDESNTPSARNEEEGAGEEGPPEGGKDDSAAKHHEDVAGFEEGPTESPPAPDDPQAGSADPRQRYSQNEMRRRKTPPWARSK